MTSSNKASKTFLIAGLAAIMLTGIQATGSAVAGQPSDQVASETVKFQDLNLDAPAGVAALYSRIHGAALRVCAGEPRDLAHLGAEKKCTQAAEARAVASVNVDALTAYFEKMTGRPPVTLASNLSK